MAQNVCIDGLVIVNSSVTPILTNVLANHLNHGEKPDLQKVATKDGVILKHLELGKIPN